MGSFYYFYFIYLLYHLLFDVLLSLFEMFILSFVSKRIYIYVESVIIFLDNLDCCIFYNLSGVLYFNDSRYIVVIHLVDADLVNYGFDIVSFVAVKLVFSFKFSLLDY